MNGITESNNGPTIKVLNVIDPEADCPIIYYAKVEDGGIAKAVKQFFDDRLIEVDEGTVEEIAYELADGNIWWCEMYCFDLIEVNL